MLESNDDNIERFDFRCRVSKNVIEYKCYKKEKEAHIEYNNIDPKIYKSYFVILRTSIDNLSRKGYQKIVQTVTEDDWNNYLKNDNKWKIKNTIKRSDINLYIIECDINDAINCISKGLGF